MGLLGDCSPEARPDDAGYTPTAIWRGNVPALFDRGLLDMVASDPQKGIFEPGAYIGEITAGTQIGEVTGGSTAVLYGTGGPPPDTRTDPPLVGSLAPAENDNYVFTVSGFDRKDS